MSTFPHAAYSRHVLRPSFESARSYFFDPMLKAHRAHVLMLGAQGLISPAKRDALWAGLAQIAVEGPDALQYQPGVEDLFFAMEQRLIALTGPEVGGDLQLARSRNDLGATIHRMALRSELLRLGAALSDLRAAILGLAQQHLDTIMPGYTHTQPAQPTTFAHYLGGPLAGLERDAGRLAAAYRTTNQSPLGVAAFTTTGFPIDRALLAELLGFEGLMGNGQDAIGASDYATESAAALLTIAAHLSRTMKDLLFWATQEAGAIRIDDSFIQISSIMPQKRNPVVLEHLRARIAQIYGGASTIFTLAHSCPYGDTQDMEDEMFDPLMRLTDVAWGVLDLSTATFATLEVNREHLRARAASGFTTATELADTLVRDYGLAFRTAHTIVSRVVQAAMAGGRQPEDVTAADVQLAARGVLDRPLDLGDDAVRAALDPQRFVERRALVGGPAPSTMRASLEASAQSLSIDRRWWDGRAEALHTADQRLLAGPPA